VTDNRLFNAHNFKLYAQGAGIGIIGTITDDQGFIDCEIEEVIRTPVPNLSAHNRRFGSIRLPDP
jgi:hypothetical protein